MGSRRGDLANRQATAEGRLLKALARIDDQEREVAALRKLFQEATTTYATRDELAAVSRRSATAGVQAQTASEWIAAHEDRYGPLLGSEADTVPTDPTDHAPLPPFWARALAWAFG